MLYDHNVRRSKVGTVWYYSKRAIEDLLASLTPPAPIGGELLSQIEEEISEKEGLDLFSAAMRAKPQCQGQGWWAWMKRAKASAWRRP